MALPEQLVVDARRAEIQRLAAANRLTAEDAARLDGVACNATREDFQRALARADLLAQDMYVVGALPGDDDTRNLYAYFGRVFGRLEPQQPRRSQPSGVRRSGTRRHRATARAPDRPRQLTGEELWSLRRLIDAATRERIEGLRCCSQCERWLEMDEFGARRSLCRRCESRRVLRLYHARAVDPEARAA